MPTRQSAKQTSADISDPSGSTTPVLPMTPFQGAGGTETIVPDPQVNADLQAQLNAALADAAANKAALAAAALTANAPTQHAAAPQPLSKAPPPFGCNDGVSDEEVNDESEDEDDTFDDLGLPAFPRNTGSLHRKPHVFQPESDQTFRDLHAGSKQEYGILYSFLSYHVDHLAHLMRYDDDDVRALVGDMRTGKNMDILTSRFDFITIKQLRGEDAASAMYEAHVKPDLYKIKSAGMQSNYKTYLRKVNTAKINRATKLTSNDRGDKRDKGRGDKDKGKDLQSRSQGRLQLHPHRTGRPPVLHLRCLPRLALASSTPRDANRARLAPAAVQSQHLSSADVSSVLRLLPVPAVVHQGDASSGSLLASPRPPHPALCRRFRRVQPLPPCRLQRPCPRASHPDLARPDCQRCQVPLGSHAVVGASRPRGGHKAWPFPRASCQDRTSPSPRWHSHEPRQNTSPLGQRSPRRLVQWPRSLSAPRLRPRSLFHSPLSVLRSRHPRQLERSGSALTAVLARSRLVAKTRHSLERSCNLEAHSDKDHVDRRRRRCQGWLGWHARRNNRCSRVLGAASTALPHHREGARCRQELCACFPSSPAWSQRPSLGGQSSGGAHSQQRVLQVTRDHARAAPTLVDARRGRHQHLPRLHSIRGQPVRLLESSRGPRRLETRSQVVSPRNSPLGSPHHRPLLHLAQRPAAALQQPVARRVIRGHRLFHTVVAPRRQLVVPAVGRSVAGRDQGPSRARHEHNCCTVLGRQPLVSNSQRHGHRRLPDPIDDAPRCLSPRSRRPSRAIPQPRLAARHVSRPLLVRTVRGRRVRSTAVPYLAALRRQLEPSLGPDMATFSSLLHASLADSDNTWGNYDDKLRLFQRWCDLVDVPSFPASRATAIRYMCYMFDRDTVHGASINQYLSAVNRWHADLGAPEPFTGRLFTSLRKGYRRLSMRRMGGRPPPPQRFASASLLRIADAALLPDVPIAVLRASAAVVHQFLFCERSDSVMFINLDDYLWGADGSLTFTEHWCKGDADKQTSAPRVLTIPPYESTPSMPNPLAVLRRWYDHQLDAGATGTDLLFQLGTSPFTGKPSDTPSALLSRWLVLCCAHAKVPSPAARSWTSHALRRGSATAALSIGVTLVMVMAWGGWKAIQSVMHYVDPLSRYRPTPADIFLFRHLLRTTFSAEPSV